jgi:ABC-type uncharacterized transport system permease subunit
MTRNRKAVQLVGETLRDVGILIFVFGPLDAFFQTDRRIAGIAISLAAVGLSLIAAGIIIEARTEGRR